MSGVRHVLTEPLHAFAAATIDYPRLLQTIAERAAVVIGDACIVRILSDDGTELMVGGSHAIDPEVDRLQREVLCPLRLVVAEQPLARGVLETGEPHVEPALDLARLRGATTSPFSSYVEQVGMHSLILVALRTQGESIGMITLARHRAQPAAFTPDDVALARDLADHAALAVANARLLRHVQQVELRAARDEAVRHRHVIDQFFTLSLDLLCIAGTDGYFRRLNPAFEATLGWSVDELTGQPFIDFVHPDDVAATVAESARLAQGVPTIRFENRYRCKDGSYRWLAWTSAPDPDGTLYAVARDVTDERAAHEQLRLARDTAETANAELEAFSYSVSHDLRAPLRAIDGFVRILLEDHGAALDDEASRVVDVIRGNTQRMGQLIDDLLRFSRLGRRGLSTRTVDMAGLAESAGAEAVAGAGREVDLRIEALPPVSGDAGLLRQVWTNLLDNAVKYSRDQPNPVIAVRATATDDEVVYSVADNGCGFDMRYVDKLFGVFQRLHNQRDFEGTGVGLALVRRIVQRHGGRAWAEGKVGEGATISFSLPRAKGPDHGA